MTSPGRNGTTRSWRDEVLDPATMTDDEIRAELRHDLRVYDEVRHPISKQAMAYRIDLLVREADARPSMQGETS